MTLISCSTYRAQLERAISKLPRVQLGQLPTPLEECPRLSDELDGPRIFVKRDDLTGLALGGNKTRHLEFTLGEAVAAGADTVVLGAAIQSNHCRQAAAAAAKLGLKAVLILRKEARSRMTMWCDPPQGNLLLDRVLGAEIHVATPEERPALVESLMARLRAEGRRPYLVGSPRLTTISYANCALELCDQLQKLGVIADRVYLASSGGSQSGLVLGGKVLDAGYRVVGFPQGHLSDSEATRAGIANTASDAAGFLGLEVEIHPEEIQICDDYVGEGFGIVSPACREAIELVARTEGILLDPVYSGKAMSGLIDHIRRGKIRACMRPTEALHRDRIRDADGIHLRYMVAECEDALAGFGLLVFQQPDTWPRVKLLPRIVDLWVRPDLRSRGIGTFMMRKMEKLAVERGYSEIFIGVDPETNRRAYVFYLRLGYEPLQEESYLEHWCFTTSDGEVHEGHDWNIDLRKELSGKAITEP